MPVAAVGPALVAGAYDNGATVHGGIIAAAALLLGLFLVFHCDAFTVRRGVIAARVPIPLLIVASHFVHEA